MQDFQRKYRRYRTDAVVWWNHDWEPEPIALMDIGAGGMLCEFPRDVGLGEEVSLSFEIPSHEGMIFCKCEAVNSRPSQSNPSFFLVGLSISKLEGMTLDQFLQCFENSPELQAEA